MEWWLRSNAIWFGKGIFFLWIQRFFFFFFFWGGFFFFCFFFFLFFFIYLQNG